MLNGVDTTYIRCQFSDHTTIRGAYLLQYLASNTVHCSQFNSTLDMYHNENERSATYTAFLWSGKSETNSFIGFPLHYGTSKVRGNLLLEPFRSSSHLLVLQLLCTELRRVGTLHVKLHQELLKQNLQVGLE